MSKHCDYCCGDDGCCAHDFKPCPECGTDDVGCFELAFTDTCYDCRPKYPCKGGCGGIVSVKGKTCFVCVDPEAETPGEAMGNALKRAYLPSVQAQFAAKDGERLLDVLDEDT